MRPGKRKALHLNDPSQAIKGKIERMKASNRDKAEHPIRAVKKQFGHVKVRYRGLKKNTAQLKTLFMLSILWMVGANPWRCWYECVQNAKFQTFDIAESPSDAGLDVY